MATMGYTTLGSSSFSVGPNRAVACRFQAPENGLLANIHCYIGGVVHAGDYVQIGIYNDNNGAIKTSSCLWLTPSRNVFTNAWVTPYWSSHSNGYTQPILTAGTYYWLLFYNTGSSPDTLTVRYNTGTANQFWTNFPLTYYNYAMSIYAEYVPGCAISASNDAGSTITPSGTVLVNTGDNQLFNISANTGYHITHVYVDTVDQGAISSYTFNNVTTTHTISVTSAINTYTLTPSAGNNGSISPSTAQTVNYGSNQTFNIIPNIGYHIVDVQVDSVSQGAISSYTFSNVTANHTITADFAQDPNTCILKISTENGGTTTPAPGTQVYSPGANVQVAATADVGYAFDYLTVDEQTNTDNPIIITMDSNHDVQAAFSGCGMNGSSPYFNCDNNCNPAEGAKGGKGTTIWGPIPDFTLEYGGENNPNSTKTFKFTATQPQCYQQQYPPKSDFCNVIYEVSTNPNDPDSPNNDVGPIELYLNDFENVAHATWHSRKAGHDLTEVFDFAQTKINETYILKEPGAGSNELKFVNEDPYVNVTIKGLMVVLGYPMCYLPCDGQNACDGGPCESAPECRQEHQYAIDENDQLDPTRQDYPCNYKSCGGVSITKFGPDDHIKSMSPSDPYISWMWINPPDPASDYVDKMHCFFNFNNITTANIDAPYNAKMAPNNDIPFWVKLNSSPWVAFYHPKGQDDNNVRHIAHGIDLATHPILSEYYNDSPNEVNGLFVTVDPNAGVDLVLCDGCDEEPCPPVCQKGGRIDIYRVYNTSPVYLTIEASVAQEGGAISPSGQVQVDYGESKTFTITPNTNYRIDDVEVAEEFENGNLHYVSQGAISNYTFNNITNLKGIRAYFSFDPSNNPPSTPSSLSGPTIGTVNVSCGPFYATSTDPEDQNITYEFNWNDGTTTTVGPYTSGTAASASHTWSSPGTKNVTVRAKDTNNAWSGAASYNTVTVQNPPTNYWVSSIVPQPTTYGNGAINNPNGLVGSSNNANFVQIYGGNSGDGGNIVGAMNAPAHGNIKIYGYSAPGYWTHIHVYVSYNANNDWVPVSNQTITSSSPYWINCGNYPSDFRYIAIAALYESGYSANLFVDSVSVTP
ncbi:MAG: PKD domain-containing protein [Candidatus Bathyarchaeota archaeon]|nr:PKD domain-containing protein [Candidatus Bathyarchaeota archaeon]